MILKKCLSALWVFWILETFAQFPPPAGQPGSTAIYKDSSVFVNWASGATVVRGYEDISNQALGYTTAGDYTMALGKAGDNGVVSLGDGGYVVLTFEKPIKDEPGWDFAVFENAFNDEFLELAFVEVSSDGANFFRIPPTSLTQNSNQINGFGSLDARKIDNLAGKYRVFYGTPFDLEELNFQTGLDINKITHIKVIDVVGCIQPVYARYDKNNNIINEPWNTPYPSGGFDLDAVGVIHQDNSGGINDGSVKISNVEIFPNPIAENSTLKYVLYEAYKTKIVIFDVLGKQKLMLLDKMQNDGVYEICLGNLDLLNGIYFINIEIGDHKIVKKIVK
jgi:hypothetical protein